MAKAGDVYMSLKPNAVSVAGTGNTTLITGLDVSRYSHMLFSMDVSTQALDAFIISIKAHSDDTYRTLKSAAADFTAPSGVLLECESSAGTGDLTTVPASGSGWFIMQVSGINSLQIQASAAADSASVQMYIGLY
jgi:hypothetical protein